MSVPKIAVRVLVSLAVIGIGTTLFCAPLLISQSASDGLGLKSSRCPGCELQRSEVVVLGNAEGPGALKGDVVDVHRDSRGRYYVLEQFSQRIKVFAAEGHHLITIGREGQGPGEFRGISEIVIGEADSLYAFDVLNGTLSVFDSDYSFIRSSQLQTRPTNRIKPVRGGHFIMASWIRTPKRIGYPLHLMDADGQLVASFGSETGEFRPGQARPVKMALATSERVWASQSHKYSPKLWHVFEGHKLREIEREVDWFPPSSAAQGPSVDEPPPPRLTSLAVDGQGRLWTKVSVADPLWEGAVEPSKDGRHIDVTDWKRYTDTVVEVLDSKTGRALARFKFESGFSFIDMEEGLVGENYLDRSLVPRYRIYRLKLVSQKDTKTNNGR